MVGSKFLGGLGDYANAKAESKAKRAWQRYSNTMVRLSDGINQNAITVNEILASDASAQQAFDIQVGELQAGSSTEVAAAASGVKGRSVTAALYDVQRNANIAEARRQEELKNTYLSIDQQRISSAMSAAMQQDHSYIPKPNFFQTMLKSGMEAWQAGKQGGMF